MPGVRRSTIAIEATRRNQEQRARVGGEIVVMRERGGCTRTELARRAGLGRMVENRLERGIGGTDLDALQRIAVALDRPLLVSFGRDLIEGPADAGHLAMQELILRLGRAFGYQGLFEFATRPSESWRSADVVLSSDDERRSMVVECLEHRRRRPGWHTFQRSQACRGGIHGRRLVGRSGARRAGLGRARDGEEQHARASIP